MTTPTTTTANQTIACLRRLMPRRALSFNEAKRLAEVQAARFLQLEAVPFGPVAEQVITSLPRLDVQYRSGLIGSGITTWERGAWRIAINTDEPVVRQRYTLAHELKHVLDAAHEAVIYRHLPKGPQRERHIEAICDSFAACLLMPRAWVKRLWGEGLQDSAELARYFDVSQQAMLIRLQALGLIEPLPRSVPKIARLGATAVRGSRNQCRPLSRKHRTTTLPDWRRRNQTEPLSALYGAS